VEKAWAPTQNGEDAKAMEKDTEAERQTKDGAMKDPEGNPPNQVGVDAAMVETKADEKRKPCDETEEKKGKIACVESKEAYRLGLSSRFVKDVNLPDGCEVEVNSKLTKKWILKNNGKSPWNDQIYLVQNIKGILCRVSGQEAKVPHLQPGEEGEVAKEFVVPSKPGKYRSTNFSLCFDGKSFGAHFWAEIRAITLVSKRLEKSKVETKTCSQNETKSKEEKMAKGKLAAHFIKDISFPANSLVAPGQVIQKSWLTKNVGNTSWPVGTKLVALEGSTFALDATSVLVVEVKAGEEHTLTIDLVAPSTTGRHAARFQLLSPTGEKFGHVHWVKVQVSEFPNKAQLKDMAREFLNDAKVVAALQEEIPTVTKKLSDGKKLAEIVELVLAKKPELKRHQFVTFIYPFLQSAESFMGLQLESLLSMYSLWAMTPLTKGLSNTQVTATPKLDKKHEKTTQDECAPAKLDPEKKTKAPENEAKQMTLFKHQSKFEQMKEMGFENEVFIKTLLMKHDGDVQKVTNELLSVQK